MIVESSLSHLLKSLVDDREHLLFPVVAVSNESIFERVSLRELGFETKAPVVDVKIDRDRRCDVLGDTLRERVCSGLRNPRRFKFASDLSSILCIHVEYPPYDFTELFWWNVCAARDYLSIAVEERCNGPTTHIVAAVDIGALFPVDSFLGELFFVSGNYLRV